MQNIKALKSICTALCSSFYPDMDVMCMLLEREGLDPYAEARLGRMSTGGLSNDGGLKSDGLATELTIQDKTLFCIALRMLRGYVESSHSEGGISVAIDREALMDNIKFWSGLYGLDAEEYFSDLSIIDDGSDRW